MKIDQNNTNASCSISFSKEDKYFAFTSDQSLFIKIFDANTLMELRKIPQSVSNNQFYFIDDNKALSINEKQLACWDLSNKDVMKWKQIFSVEKSI